jgi:hypothetical protein
MMPFRKSPQSLEDSMEHHPNIDSYTPTSAQLAQSIQSDQPESFEKPNRPPSRRGPKKNCTAEEQARVKEVLARAEQALSELDKNSQAQISKMLNFGEAVHEAKTLLRHGQYQKWCDASLHRSPSWVSSHRRLFENKDAIEPAQTWASQSNHKWANCVSVERLLRVIDEYKASEGGSDPTVPSTKRRSKAAEKRPTLRARLKKAEQLLNDLLSVDYADQVRAWSQAAETGSADARDSFASLKEACQAQVRTLLESCSAQQL